MTYVTYNGLQLVTQGLEKIWKGSDVETSITFFEKGLCFCSNSGKEKHQGSDANLNTDEKFLLKKAFWSCLQILLEVAIPGT